MHPGEYKVIVPGATTGDVTKGNTEAFNEALVDVSSGEPPGTAIGS